jgi:hypothetical protein
MVTAARILVCLVAPTFCVACSQAGGPAVEAAPAAQTHGVVIAQIVTHDSKVAILGGGGDLRVVVRKTDGTMVADGISVAELRARDPEIYMVVTSSFASKDGYVDATLDLGHIN